MKKLRFGVVGTSAIAEKVIAGGRQDARFEVAALCSRSRERADAFAARNAIEHTFTSLEAMAESDIIDAVYIATPNSLHAGQSIACMQRGKHVLCEKPFASNANEVKQMIAASRKYGVTLMEAMISTLNPNFNIVRENLARLGTLRRYFACYCQYSSRYDQFKEGILPNAFNPALSGGGLVDIGVYTIYPMVVLFGRPLKIDAMGILLSNGVDGQGSVNFGYAGFDATVLYSKIADSYLQSEIGGEAGSLLLDKIQIIRNITFMPHRTPSSGWGGEVEGERIGVKLDRSPYYYEIAEFIDIIERGDLESTINSHTNSLITMEIMDEIRQQLNAKCKMHN